MKNILIFTSLLFSNSIFSQDFKIELKKVEPSLTFYWEVENEPDSVVYSIYQLKPNVDEWEMVEEIVGDLNQNQIYSFKPILYAGINKFFVSIGDSVKSNTIEYATSENQASKKYVVIDRKIKLGDVVSYEVRGKFGFFLFGGKGDVVDVSELAEGTYLLTIGDDEFEIEIKD